MTETVPFRPYSGKQSGDFIRRWCGFCKRDKAHLDGTGDSCPIVAATFVYGVDDPKYPKEWIVDKGDALDKTARCTAFDPVANTLVIMGDET